MELVRRYRRKSRPEKRRPRPARERESLESVSCGESVSHLSRLIGCFRDNSR